MTDKLVKWENIYKVGIIAYTIFENSGQKLVKCEACKGKGYIKQNGNEFQCMKCFGNGDYYKKIDIKWEVDNSPSVITKVEIEKSKKIDKYKVLYWFGCNGKYAENVFLTKNAAIKECIKRNDKNKEIE